MAGREPALLHTKVVRRHECRRGTQECVRHGGDHQKWTAITLGGPPVPDITLTERTTCMFLLDQSLGAFFTASAKYAGLVRNSAAAARLRNRLEYFCTARH